MKLAIVLLCLGLSAYVSADGEEGSKDGYPESYDHQPKGALPYYGGFHPLPFPAYPYYPAPYPGFAYGYPGPFAFAGKVDLRYYGVYTGKCSKDVDGVFYNDAHSLMVCSNGRAFVQPCPPGSVNSPQEKYEERKEFTRADFCDVNLQNNIHAPY